MKAHKFLLAIKTQKNGEYLDKIATMIVSCPEEAAVKLVTMNGEGSYLMTGQLYKMDFEYLKLIEIEIPILKFEYGEK